MNTTENPFLDVDRGIIADAYTSNETRDVLHTLSDTIGIRFAGTDGERRGAEYIAGKFEEYGLDSVEIEEFRFDAWRRGDPASLQIVGENARRIPCLALPYGAPTPQGGVTSTLIDIGPGAAKDVERFRDRIRGNIVLTEATGAHRGEIYGRVVEAGAVGFILIGRAPGMMLPTGCVSFGKAGSIPAIGIAHESGLQIQRMSVNGDITLEIRTFDSFEAGTSRNVVGELRGARFPDEYVAVGGHMDSHDVAPGAVDNASGTTCVVETARLLALQRSEVERTIRFITFGAEEVGLLGSYHHAEAHAGDMAAMRFMLNLDCLVMSRPKGLVFHNLPTAEEYVTVLRAQIQEPLPFFDRIHAHSDHFPFILKGVPTGEIGGGRFNPGVKSFAHMAGDTADKVSLIDLREESALAARLLFRASNDPDWPFATRTPAEVEQLLEESGIKKAMEFENQPGTR
jgi:aminopeptidase YwaD